ncbi:MAG: hypothetical protein PHY47_20575 [Lachnospiraceae bacterium]|nr:hypothetical protein [Lachnospiraceae bacterium]
MDFSTIVNLSLSVLSFVLALFSLVFVIISLRQNQKMLQQNNKMLEDASRPFVSIYIDSITICEQSSFFVLKNFGKSPAKITKFDYDPILKSTTQSDSMFNVQFDYVSGIILSPGQSKTLQYNVSTLGCDSITFSIDYESGEKVYSETVVMNVKNYIHIPVSRPETHVLDHDKRQVHTLREIVERFM